jgi:hypothetical protein
MSDLPPRSPWFPTSIPGRVGGCLFTIVYLALWPIYFPIMVLFHKLGFWPTSRGVSIVSGQQIFVTWSGPDRKAKETLCDVLRFLVEVANLVVPTEPVSAIQFKNPECGYILTGRSFYRPEHDIPSKVVEGLWGQRVEEGSILINNSISLPCLDVDTKSGIQAHFGFHLPVAVSTQRLTEIAAKYGFKIQYAS